MADLEEYLAIYSKCESDKHIVCGDCRKCILSKRIKFVDNLAQSVVHVSVCDVLIALEQAGILVEGDLL